MRIRQTLLLTLLLMVLPIVGACATESQTEPTPTPPTDVPYLSTQEAISIAREHSMTSPQAIYEKQAGVYARAGSSQGWSAKYIGNGKWTVELRLRYDSGDITIYRWTVFESNLTAVFVGAYKGN